MNFKQQIKKFRRNAKAVSPVIATIILVAMSIVMAIAVAYWALGIGNSFTKFEKIQYSSTTYALPNETGDGWVVTMDVQNTGTATATISGINLNGIPMGSYPVTGGKPTADYTATIAPGDSQTITVTLLSAEEGLSGAAHSWVSGMTVGIDVTTAAGNSYPTTVLLP